MINECSTKIETLTGDIAVDEAGLKAATDLRVKEQTAFADGGKELVAVELAILARERKKGASMLQLQNAGCAAQVFQVMVQASAFSPAGASRVTALLQSTQEESDSE